MWLIEILNNMWLILIAYILFLMGNIDLYAPYLSSFLLARYLVRKLDGLSYIYILVKIHASQDFGLLYL